MRTVLTLLPILLLVLSCSAYGSGFDLDLKELQKPVYPASGTGGKQKIVGSPRKSRSVQKPEAAVETAPAKQTEASVPLPEISPPVTSVTAELILKAGDSCRFGEQVAVAVARSVPAERLLNGLNFRTVAAVTAGDLKLLVSCGLADAEAYTYNRLLDEHQVQLLNLKATDAADQVMERLLTALGLSYLLEQHELAQGGEDRYLVLADKERERPLRLILQP